MTEITVEIDDRECINSGAFVVALILAPLVSTAPFAALGGLFYTFGWEPTGLMFIVAISVLSLPCGALQYLALGTPAFIFALRRNRSTAFAGFLANLVSLPIVSAFFVSEGFDSAFDMTIFFAVFGSVFAPFWGAVFGKIYRKVQKVFP